MKFGINFCILSGHSSSKLRLVVCGNKGGGGENQRRVDRLDRRRHHVPRAEENGRAHPEVLGLARDRHLARERQGLAQQECQKGSFTVSFLVKIVPMGGEIIRKRAIMIPRHRLKRCSHVNVE